jgi:hypothetical protein
MLGLPSFNSTNKISWLRVIILGLIPLGQLWARIFDFNGSLDKWWLMFPLLLIPPFSFIPMLMMKFGFIADGKGSKPLDSWILVPIITKLVLAFLLPYIVDEDSTFITFIVSLIFQLIATMCANLVRRYKNCNQTITTDSIGKAGIDSTIAMAVGDLSAIIIPWLPFVGMFISILEMIPIIGEYVDSILWIIGFSATYTLINMFNQDDMTKYCSTPFTGNLQDKIPFIISVIVTFLAPIVNSFL